MAGLRQNRCRTYFDLIGSVDHTRMRLPYGIGSYELQSLQALTIVRNPFGYSADDFYISSSIIQRRYSFYDPSIR